MSIRPVSCRSSCRLGAAIAALAMLVVVLGPKSAAAEPGILPFKPGVTVGAVIGKLQLDEDLTGESVGLYAQVELGRLGFTGEIARTSYEVNQRTDRRTGGGLTIRLISVSDVSLFVRATAGLIRASINEQTIADQIYGSAGGGIAILLTRNLSLTAEALGTARRTVRRSDEIIPAVVFVEDNESLTHLRLGVALSF